MSDTAAMFDTPRSLPPTTKQMIYARSLALEGGTVLPRDVQKDRAALSRWIDHQKQAGATSPFHNYPTSKQVAFAERIARMKRSSVPDECFRDRQMLSRWIDHNK